MDAARQMRSLFYYAPRKLVIHERQVPEFTGSASLQQNRLRGLASPGEHCDGSSRLWLLACGIPSGPALRHWLGPNRRVKDPPAG